MRRFSLLMLLAMIVILLIACETSESNLDGDSDTNGDVEEDDAIPDGDILPDGDITEGSIEEQICAAYECDSQCWQFSSLAVTDDDATLSQWQNACTEADSECPDIRCEAVVIDFIDGDSHRYAVQCESYPNALDELELEGMWEGWELGWLGPDYGQVGNDFARIKETPSGWIKTSTTENDLVYLTPPAPAWTDATIESALAHDTTAIPCEEIADYDQCVRAFIPPYTHCTPILMADYPDYQCGMLLWSTWSYSGYCTSASEPFATNRLNLCEQNSETHASGLFRNTESGAYVIMTANPNDPKWEIATDYQKPNSESWRPYFENLTCDETIPAAPLPEQCNNGPITFGSETLEEEIREAINKPQGDIVAADLTGIITFHTDSSSLEGLECIPSLCMLDSGESFISDLTPLAGLTRLQHLFFFENQITDISALGGLVNLRTLTLDRNPVADFSPLQNLTKLERLSVYGIADLSVLSSLTDLRVLIVNGDNLENLSPLAGLTKLLYLIIDGENENLTNLSALSTLQNLEFLGVQGAISDLTPLSGLTQLQSLGVSGGQVSDLSPLATLTGLERLVLSHNSISDIGPLEGLVNLSSLSLLSNAITDLGPLARNTGIRCPDDIRLDGNPIDCSAQQANLDALAARGVILYPLCDSESAKAK